MHSFYGTRLSENMAKTPEGYLICYDVHIARIGTQEYLGSELGAKEDVVVVNRPPEEVFKPSTIASFEGKPFTNDHPFELLDVSNTSIYEKGHLQNVRVSEDKIYLDADIMVKDEQTIKDIEGGKREVSAGYNCDCVQDENGNWYQCNIIGNHVALVDKGRAGEKVRINDAEFNEQDHPRGKDGKFTSGGGSEGGSTSEKSKENTSSKEIKHLKISGGGQALSNFAFSAYPTQVKKLEEKGEIPKGIYGAGGNSGKEAVFKAILYKHRNDNLKEICNALNSSGITYRNWQPADGFEQDDKVSDFGKAGAELWAKDYNGNWQSLYLKPQDESNNKKPNSIEKIKDQKKEKTMKDQNSVLGKLLKAFAQDAEPEEMVEALEAVKGKDEEPDRLAKLEKEVADMKAVLDSLAKPTADEEPELTALDECEKELEDEEPEKKEEEVKDEDANNDPKLIEAQAEKAQNDEDTTEEIKKEISDAKKVIAKIEDKETRLAVADSLAKVIRGKMKSSANYKKLMDAATKKPSGGSKAIDYSAVFKKIKEEKFRK